MHQVVRLEDFSVIVLRESEETGGQFCLCEVNANPQTTFSWHHLHVTFDQLVVGVEGITRWLIGSEYVVVGPGERLFIPRGTVHSFVNWQAYSARFLCIYTPAVISGSFFEQLYDAMQMHGEARLAQVRATLESFDTTLVSRHDLEKGVSG